MSITKEVSGGIIVRQNDQGLRPLPSDGSITEAMLAGAVQNKLNKLEFEDLKDFSWTSASQVTQPASSILVGTQGNLDDADLLTAGSLVFDFANGTGDNGLDTGSETNDQWYALYAVPGTTGTYKLKASVNLPHAAGGTGPDGFTQYRYLGLFRNGDQSSFPGDIKRFFKSGSLFALSPVSGATTHGVELINTTGTTATWAKSVSMSGASVPLSNANYTWRFTNNTNGNRAALQGRDSGAVVMWENEATAAPGTGSAAKTDGYINSLIADVFITTDASGTLTLSLIGWVDPYIRSV